MPEAHVGVELLITMVDVHRPGRGVLIVDAIAVALETRDPHAIRRALPGRHLKEAACGDARRHVEREDALDHLRAQPEAACMRADGVGEGRAGGYDVVGGDAEDFLELWLITSARKHDTPKERVQLWRWQWIGGGGCGGRCGRGHDRLC